MFRKGKISPSHPIGQRYLEKGARNLERAEDKEKRGRFYFLAKYFVHSVSEGKIDFEVQGD